MIEDILLDVVLAKTEELHDKFANDVLKLNPEEMGYHHALWRLKQKLWSDVQKAEAPYRLWDDITTKLHKYEKKYNYEFEKDAETLRKEGEQDRKFFFETYFGE